MGEVQYIWPDPTNASNQTAFSSIVQAMLAQNVVAIARFVSRDDMDPRMGLLIPRDFEEVDCFLFLMMPFADDVRRYVFPPLINLVSKKGEKVESHAYLPTTEQEAAMEKFVDDMDLMQAGEKDEEGYVSLQSHHSSRCLTFSPTGTEHPGSTHACHITLQSTVSSKHSSTPLSSKTSDRTRFLLPIKKR